LRNIENAHPVQPQAIEFNQLTPGSSLRLVLAGFTQKRAGKSRQYGSLRSERMSTSLPVDGNMRSG
jgi:hypothetical protein